MKKLIGLIACLMLFGLSSVWAQSKSVTGTVTDQSGVGLPGVSVSVKGTSVGTNTDIDGKWALSVTSDDIIIISFVGMKTQEIKVGNKTVFKVILEENRVAVDEVVVTAFGMKKSRKAIGYAVQDVKADKLTQAGNSSFAGALQGKISGVEIKPSSGMPGASSQMVIRGARSFTGDNTPLYVVDGMPISSSSYFSTGNGVTGSDIANRAVDIDPNDIESINILKGQAASALYGIRASNGVVVITTKSGKGLTDGKPVVSFSTNFSVEQISRKPDFQNTWAQGYNGKYSPRTSLSWGPRVEDLPNDATYGGNVANTLNGGNITKYAGMYYVPQRADAGLDPWVKPQKYDNFDDFMQLGHSNSNSFNVSQGTKNGSFSIGLGNSTQEGIVPSTSMDRYSAKLSAERKFGKAWKTGFSSNYVENQIDKASSANDALLGTVFPTPINYNQKGIPINKKGLPYEQINYRSLTFDNPYWGKKHNKFTEKTNRFIGNAFVEYTPQFDWSEDKKLSFKYQIGTDFYSSEYQDIFEYGHRGKTGSIDNYGVTTVVYNSLLTANYSMDLMDGLNFNLLLGNEINQEKNKQYSETGSQFNFGGWAHINNATVKDADERQYKNRTVGFFGNISFDYKGIVYLNATGRNDIVSTMPRNNRSFFYYSTSLGLVLTELDVLKNNETISFAKLRASYAEVGQAGKYINNYYSVPSYGGGFWSDAPITYPLGGVTTYVPNLRMYDPKLKPQNTVSYEFGADVRFFNNFIGIDYTFSRQNVSDQIFPVPLAGSSGSSERMMNGGKMHTNSHELSISINPIIREDMEWSMNINYTKMENYVDELAPGVESIFLGGFTTPQVRAGVGDKFPVIYGDQFKKDSKGRILVDEDPNSQYYGMPMTGEPGVIGSVSPDFNMGFYNSFRFKRVTLSFTLDWKSGGEMYSGTNGLLDLYGRSARTADRTSKFIYDGYKADGTKNDIVRGGAGDPTAVQDLYADVLTNIDEYYIHGNSFIKLREILVRYDLPKIKKVSMSFSVYARNILLWTELDNLDPESSQGSSNMGGSFERFSMPQTSSFGLGLNIKF
ncbi:MAG: SusC/RagA family TonB-linked outer membrane protein [Marinifilaceae bacterium]